MICTQCDKLVDDHSVATTRLHRAIAELVRVAGRNQPDRFASAMAECTLCRNECDDVTSALVAHKTAHESA